MITWTLILTIIVPLSSMDRFQRRDIRKINREQTRIERKEVREIKRWQRKETKKDIPLGA